MPSTPIDRPSTSFTDLFKDAKKGSKLSHSQLSHFKSAQFLNHTQLKFKPRYVVSALGGVSASWLYENTGVGTAMHEVVGHGQLGMHLTCDYPQHTGPTYGIAGFEKCKAIGEASSPGEGIKSFFSWLLVPPNNRLAGFAEAGPNYHENGLATHIGSENTSAWLSISGSIPGLVINTSSVVAGMLLRRKYPTLGIALATFGIANSLIEGSYAATAATMSAETLKASADRGHDFANFAIQMSHTTGLNAHLIAAGVALFWLGFVPLIALAIYLYQNAHKTDIVPNDLALKYWLSQLDKSEVEEKHFDDLLKKYLEEEKSPSTEDFLKYLLKHLPEKTIREAKEQLLKQWQSLQTPSKVERFFTFATLGTVILSTVTQILNLFANSTVPTLLPAVIILKTILPILGLISIARSAYETYKDFKCPHSQVPIAAKVLSCLNLVTTLIMVTLMIVAAFVPGLQFFAIPAVLTGTLLAVSFSFAKMKVIQGAYQKTANSSVKEEQQPANEAPQTQSSSPLTYGTFFAPQGKCDDNKPTAVNDSDVDLEHSRCSTCDIVLFSK